MMNDIVKYYPMDESLLIYAKDGETSNPNATTMQAMMAYMVQNGDTVKNLVDNNLWQPNTEYANGIVISSPNMPSGFCAVATFEGETGTTSDTEPSWQATEDKQVSDGSVTWVMKKKIFILPKVIADVVDGDKLTFKYSDESEKKIAIVKTVNKKSPDDQGDVEVFAALVGDVFYRPYLAPNHVKANGATVNRSDYPTLKDFADKNNMWTTNPTNEPWKYGVGDGSKTMVLPDYRGRVIQGGDIAAVIEPGLPNIKGSIPVILRSVDYVNEDITEAFSISSKRSYAYQNSAGSEWYKVNFNAADSNAIYSNSDTVQPPALQLIPQIKY